MSEDGASLTRRFAVLAVVLVSAWAVVATALLLGRHDVPPGATGTRLEIRQEAVDGPFAIQWFMEGSQRAAQTFTPVEGARSLVAIAPHFEYAQGEGGTLSLYVLTDPEDPDSGELVRTIPLEATKLRSGFNRLVLAPPVVVPRGAVLSSVVEAAQGSSLAVGFTSFTQSANVYPGGAMYHAVGSGASEYPGGDLAFRAEFSALGGATPS
jgi:hypothetical protein